MDRAKLTSSLAGSRPKAYHEDYALARHSDPASELYMMQRGQASRGSPIASRSYDSGRGIGYRPSRTIDGHDLKRSIKEQVHGGAADQDDYGSLCERRLIFELKNLPDPSKAAASLMHWVTEQSHADPEHVGFVSCDQLQQILVHRLGLKMSPKEISLLAMGFASDGQDNINAEEFNSALQTLFHSSVGAEGHAETEEEAAWRIALGTIRHLARDLLTHKKFAPLLRHRLQVLKLVESQDEVGLGEEIDALKVSVMDAVSKPFFLMDDNRNGIITAKGFTKIINFFSPGISDDEVSILVSSFKKQPSAQDHSRVENDFITEYRTQQLRGSLRGAATGTGNGDLSSWLQQSLPGQMKSDAAGAEGKQLVDYREFIEQLVEAVLDVILDVEAGVDQIPQSGLDPEEAAVGHRKGSSLPPLITGFGELIDTLLSHLETLPASRRRQCLILLQTTLMKQSAAEGNAEGSGYLDGFAVLKALVAAGFPLARALRAKFLKDVEDMSGKFNFLELCRFLMSSCCSWPSEERQVMSKVLKAMGVTTEQRREWIIQLKKDLCLASADYKLNYGSQSAHPVSLSASKRSSTASDQNWMHIVEENSQDGVPASTFLHCLREAGVHLSVDDEATLLDCLDFESQALEMNEEEATVDPLLMNADRKTLGTSNNALSVSLIKYSNFLSICARHAGKWYQASPALNEHLKMLLMDKHDADVIAGLKEFNLLLKTFDEESNGKISYRPFLISCRRSRLLSQLEPEVVTELTKVLAEEGAGTISYELFLLHLKSLHHQIKTLRSLKKEVVASHKSETFQLFNQLLAHGSDKTDGTLQPLRRWILHAVDKNKQNMRQREEFLVDPNVQVLSRQDVADLLRDFNVVYSPEDMEVFLDDMKMSSAIYDYFSETDASPLHFRPKVNGKLDEFFVDPSNLLHCLLQSRPPWALRNPKLTLKVKKLLSRASTNAVETLISRLRSFARYTNLFPAENELVIDFADDEDGENGYAELMDKKVEKPPVIKRNDTNKAIAVNSAEAFISKDAFTQVIHSCGLNLSPSDIDFLADECDASLDPSRIRVGILLEALSDSGESGGLQDVLQGVRETMHRDAADKHLHKQGTSKSKTRVHGSAGKYGSGERHGTAAGGEVRHTEESSAAFAVKHLQTLLLNSADVLRRSTAEWSCDVLSLMDGFDRGGGVCTPQDFVMGLHLLSVRLSGDLLANIPRISKSVDMIPYKKLLELVFAESIQEEKSTLYDDGVEQSAYRDLVYGDEEAELRRGGTGRSSSAPRHVRGERQRQRQGGGQRENVPRPCIPSFTW
jgi:Ca2+-binding EF-hand superfamily protein